MRERHRVSIWVIFMDAHFHSDEERAENILGWSRKVAKSQRQESFATLRLCVILQRAVLGMLFYVRVPKVYHRSSFIAGSAIVKAVPLPGALSTLIWPPC